GPDPTINGGNDVFVAKVAPNGATLVYAGFLGGTGTDIGWGIAVDAAGAAYVTGQTNSTEASFPETVGPDLITNGSNDAFVAKVAADGASLTYAGFIGGSSTDIGYGIAVDAAGAAYVTGSTSSTEATFPDAVGPDLFANGGPDAFVAKVAPDGTGLAYAGYIGGGGIDRGYGIAVDTAGAVYVVGYTDSIAPPFPATVGPDLTRHDSSDAFVAKV